MLKFQQLFQVSLLLTLAIAAASCRSYRQREPSPSRSYRSTELKVERASFQVTLATG